MVGWVEAWSKDRKRTEGGRINMTTAMLSHRGMEGIHFCSPKRFRKVETRPEKRLSSWVFLLSRVVPPWLPATGGVRAARDSGKLAAENSGQTLENSSQFAICSLKRVKLS
jgi:hypothetical protein